MKPQTAFFNLDFQGAASSLESRGLKSGGSLELLNFNLTLHNPRNRVLSFPNIGTDTSKLWHLALRAAHSVQSFDEAEEFLLEVAMMQDCNDLLKTFVESSLVEEDAISTTLLIRQNRLSLIHAVPKCNLFDLPLIVFAETFRQEALMTRLKQALPHLDLGFSFFNFGVLFVDADDARLVSVIEKERVFDLEMIPMDTLTSTLDLNEGSQYWTVLKSAFVDESEEALHSIFGQDH